HVAGSKGKGSICAITASILKEAGFSVGLYTSPHIYNFLERIRVLDAGVNAKQDALFPDVLSERELCDVLEEVKPIIEEYCLTKDIDRLSVFEVFTVVALVYFRKRKVDIAVLETGLGGRLDATNAVESLVAVIAPISLEHTNILGDNVKAIAAEKAAIIKEGTKAVIVAMQEQDVLELIEKRSKEHSISPLAVGREIAIELVSQDLRRQIFNVIINEDKYLDIKMNLLGKHQAHNAAAAIGAVQSLKNFGFAISVEAIYKGIQKCFWPGRFEVFNEEPMIILDGAHNEASCSLLVDTITTLLPGKRVVLVLGFSRDKDKAAICRQLSKVASKVVFTKADHPRSSEIAEEDLKAFFPYQESFVTPNVEEALILAREKVEDDGIILIAGSLFVVSEARMIIGKEKEYV
ncbi:MAG: hypothetical protein KKD07_06510, partial [Candidatus Omnitrophica bacterium]|nr:hypothetical protein [Candidatus Omnitrophota bacterium]